MKNSASTRCALWIPCIPCWWYYLVVLLVQIGIWWSHSMNWSVFHVEKGVHVHLLFKICSINVSSSQNSKAKYTRNLSPTRLKPALIFSWLRLGALQPTWPTRLKACCGQPLLGPGDGYPVILSPWRWMWMWDAATVNMGSSTERNMDVASNKIDCCCVVTSITEVIGINSDKF